MRQRKEEDGVTEPKPAAASWSLARHFWLTRVSTPTTPPQGVHGRVERAGQFGRNRVQMQVQLALSLLLPPPVLETSE